MKKLILVFISLVMLLSLGLFVNIQPLSAVAGLEPTYKPANVDGEYDEWLPLEENASIEMHRAWKPDKPLESTAYLRFDDGIMYVLVLVEDGVEGLVEGNEAWIKLDDNKVCDSQDPQYADDGIAPDFHWVGLYANGTKAQGYEASFPVNSGSHSISIHLQVYDDGESQTSGAKDVQIYIFPPFNNVPELPAVALLGLGLAAIGVVIVIRRRSRQVSAG